MQAIQDREDSGDYMAAMLVVRYCGSGSVAVTTNLEFTHYFECCGKIYS